MSKSITRSEFLRALGLHRANLKKTVIGFGVLFVAALIASLFRGVKGSETINLVLWVTGMVGGVFLLGWSLATMHEAGQSAYQQSPVWAQLVLRVIGRVLSGVVKFIVPAAVGAWVYQKWSNGEDAQIALFLVGASGHLLLWVTRVAREERGHKGSDEKN